MCRDIINTGARISIACAAIFIVERTYYITSKSESVGPLYSFFLSLGNAKILKPLNQFITPYSGDYNILCFNLCKNHVTFPCGSGLAKGSLVPGALACRKISCPVWHPIYPLFNTGADPVQ